MANVKKRTVTRGIGATVLEYMEKHPDVTVYRDDIAKDCGLPAERIAGTITNLRSRDVNHADSRLEVIIAGRAWVWHSKSVGGQSFDAKPAKRVFGEIGPTSDGGIIIEDPENGKLYKATEL